MKEIIICAAVKTRGGEVIRCHRHGHGLATIAAMGREPMRAAEGQGFVTSTNRFVTRAEAYELQLAAGIKSVARGGYVGEQLYSEDLY
jgi:hypothetical protein